MATAYDKENDTAAATGCGCFRRFCFGRDDEESRSFLLGEGAPPQGIKAQLKKLRELSELVAGPKWKNFIRKIGRIFNAGKQHDRTAGGYTPESYALNFAGDGRPEDADFLRSFSTRYAAGFFANDQHRRAATQI